MCVIDPFTRFMLNFETMSTGTMKNTNPAHICRQESYISIIPPRIFFKLPFLLSAS